jgi:type II secretory pathway component PulF
MNTEDLIALNEEIAGMARAGLPLDQGLAAMAKEMGRGRLQQVTAAIAEDLRAGTPLPDALERQAGRVPAFYGGLVAAGIRTGRIAEVLATLTMYARAIRHMRTIIVDALFYPAVVLVFGIALFAVLCVFILPQFDDIYRQFSLNLPAVSAVALKLGQHPRELVVYPIAGLIAILVLANLSMRFTERGRYRWAEIVYATPLLGTFIRSARLAAFTDLLAILVDYAIPLPEAFGLAGAASSDPVMAVEARNIQQELSQGKPLGQVLRGRGLVPEWVSWMTGLGEQRGTLGKTLHQVAEMYRRDVTMRAAVLKSVLPPFFIICIAGVFVALFVFTGILPMLGLLEGLSK